nr:unnamed protein product [Callosobruchus chinensis]
MEAPPVADPRSDTTLDCQFDMGGEELYAVKWYKDDQEFFRYAPGHNPDTTTFPVEGVRLASTLTDCGLDHCRVTLHQPSREHGAGAYRCEVSSEAPAFRLASQTRKIVIAGEPF